ncbi:MAG TPA: hypothetical protein VIZ65_10715 [Cellvibrionaceae bacterium]
MSENERVGIQSRINQYESKFSAFLQGVSELVPIKYILEYYPVGAACPRGKPGSNVNVDLSYLAEGFRINIEIKCPDSERRETEKSDHQLVLYTPYSFSSSEESKTLASKASQGMDVGLPGNDIKKLESFLNDCVRKFSVVSKSGELNVALISLSSPEEMDEWRLKIQVEGVLKNFPSIHTVILSSIAYEHRVAQRGGNRQYRLNLNECFNVIYQNQHYPKNISQGAVRALVKTFPNHNEAVSSWLSIFKGPNLDPLNLLDMLKLQKYYEYALSVHA